MTVLIVIAAWFLAGAVVGAVVGRALALRDAVQVPERAGAVVRRRECGKS